MDYTLTDPQSEFLLSDSKYTAAVAGFGSGKTSVALVRMLRNMLESPTIDQAYFAPTYPLIKDIFYPKFTGLLEDIGINYKVNVQSNTVKLQGRGTVYCRTMEKPDRIVGYEVADAFLDEFDILDTDKAITVFNKVSARLRQKNPTGRKNQLFVTTTPEGFKGTYELFKKNPIAGSQLIQMSTYSNQANLTDDYIDSLLSQYPEQLIKAYLNGEFVNLTSGQVYYSYDRKRCDTKYVIAPRETLHIGMDFNVYNMAAIVNVMRDGIAYAVDELIDLRDTPDMIETIKQKYPDHAVIVYPDASGGNTSSKGSTLSDIKLLRDAGFKIKAEKSNPLVKDRVQSVNSAFDKSLYFVNADRCPVFVTCLEQQVYDDNGAPDKKAGLDHALDAGGYFVHQNFPINKRQAFTQAINIF